MAILADINWTSTTFRLCGKFLPCLLS